MMLKEKCYLAFKTIPLLLCMTVLSANPIDIIRQYSDSGQGFIRLVNNTDYSVYCTITGKDTRYFKDFYVRAHSSSRFYIEPVGYYVWGCR